MGVVTRFHSRLPRVDPLGAVAEEEVDAGDQAGALLEDRRDQLGRGARVGGRLQRDGGAGPQVAGQHPGRVLDVAQVGRALAERRGHRDHRDVEPGQGPRVGRRVERSAVQDALQLGRRDVVHVGLADGEPLDPFLVDVEPDDRVAHLGGADREGQPHVSLAGDDDPHGRTPFHGCRPRRMVNSGWRLLRPPGAADRWGVAGRGQGRALGQPAQHGDQVLAGHGRVEQRQHGAVQRRYRGLRDQRVVGPQVLLVRAEQDLVHLLAGPQPGVDDLDVPVGRGGQPAGHVGDPYRLAHVQHQHLAGAVDGAGLDDQAHRLLHGHEVPADLGVGDGDGAACLDLRGEGGQHRATAAEHVAEPDAAVGAGSGLVGGGGQPLGDPLGVAEHVARVGGLVGGDVDQAFHVVPQRGLQDLVGTDDVGLERLGRVHLEQRQVLERRGVEHHLRPVLVEHLVQALLVADVGDDQVAVVEHAAAVDGELHGVQPGLVAVEHDQPGRVEPGQLAAQFRADRAAGPGDQHPPALQVAGDRLQVDADLAAAEQVGVADRPDVLDAHRTAEQLDHRRGRP